LLELTQIFGLFELQDVYSYLALTLSTMTTKHVKIGPNDLQQKAIFR